MSTFRLAAMLSLAAAPLAAQITVQGVADRTVYVDRVTLRVPSAAGYVYTARLAGEPLSSEKTVPTDTDVLVDQPQFYQLTVERRPSAGGATQTLVVRFIVRSSERQNSEWGLPPWVPYPLTNSAAAEYQGAQLSLIVPPRFPRGLSMPVAAWVEDAEGKRVGVNDWATASGFPDFTFQVLRGVGSGYFPAATAGGALPISVKVGPLETLREVVIEDSTSWTSVSGSLAASADWGEDARVQVTGSLTVPAGVTLTIGAGSVVRLGAGVDLNVNGKLLVNGTRERPVVFVPQSGNSPWGGLVVGFRPATSGAEVTMTGAVLGAGCANRSWFDDNSGSGESHLPFQALLYASNGAQVNLTDCALLESPGQALHGESSTITLTRCLIQRFTNCGQFNACTLQVDRSAVIEFPGEEVPFADDDGDGIYLTGGGATISDTLLGWAHDDTLDAGSGGGSNVRVSGCWVEGSFHEGTAWSGGSSPVPRRADLRDTVVINCGQGIECGWDYAMVTATHCLSTANLIGARFGDNYDWDYFGRLNVTGSYLLYNGRNIWGRAWDATAAGWEHHLSQMDLEGNFLSQADALHPSNSLWEPAAGAAGLIPFLPTPATRVGVGIALRETEQEMDRLPAGIPVRLSTFTSIPVSVKYSLESETGPLGGGTLEFAPGESVKVIHPDPGPGVLNLLRVSLLDPVNGELTDVREATYYRLTRVTLLPAGARWRYLDTGVNQLTAWRQPAFLDGGWKEGPAELGFGDGESTPVNGGPAGGRFPALYFRSRFNVEEAAEFRGLEVRLKRDDGAVVYLNGMELFRSNMPSGTVSYGTWASSAISGSDESAFSSTDTGAELLVGGENVIAVEIHQSDADSSDLSFDLELIGKRLPPTATPGFIRGDAGGDGSVDLGDVLKVLFHLFAGEATDCADALDADDSGALGIPDALRVLGYLFLEGPPFAGPFPAKGPDPTEDPLGCNRE